MTKFYKKGFIHFTNKKLDFEVLREEDFSNQNVLIDICYGNNVEEFNLETILNECLDYKKECKIQPKIDEYYHVFIKYELYSREVTGIDYSEWETDINIDDICMELVDADKNANLIDLLLEENRIGNSYENI